MHVQQGLAGFPVALLDAGDYLTRHHRKYVCACVCVCVWGGGGGRGGRGRGRLEGRGRGEVAKKNGVWWGGGWVVEVETRIEEGVQGGWGGEGGGLEGGALPSVEIAFEWKKLPFSFW